MHTENKIDLYLKAMIDNKASDLYITHGNYPTLRIEDKLQQIGTHIFHSRQISIIINSIINEKQKLEFLSKFELNMSYSDKQNNRFRFNFFRQQGYYGFVIRRIVTEIPTLEQLGLPKIYSELIMKKSGLILIASAAGTGKSTSMASMVDYRNKNSACHILTVEDPIEFVYPNGKSIITQREIGEDTMSYADALKNGLRQKVDVAVIGEIRDKEVMDHALRFAETGHLCIATIHSRNSTQALERILGFYSYDLRRHILLSAAQNLLAIISQKLIINQKKTRSLIYEIILIQDLVRSLILNDKLDELRDVLERSNNPKNCSFDSRLLQLYDQGIISFDVAIAEAENSANLALKIKQLGK